MGIRGKFFLLNMFQHFDYLAAFCFHVKEAVQGREMKVDLKRMNFI